MSNAVGYFMRVVEDYGNTVKEDLLKKVIMDLTEGLFKWLLRDTGKIRNLVKFFKKKKEKTVF